MLYTPLWGVDPRTKHIAFLGLSPYRPPPPSRRKNIKTPKKRNMSYLNTWEEAELREQGILPAHNSANNNFRKWWNGLFAKK